MEKIWNFFEILLRASGWPSRCGCACGLRPDQAGSQPLWMFCLGDVMLGRSGWDPQHEDQDFNSWAIEEERKGTVEQLRNRTWEVPVAGTIKHPLTTACSHQWADSPWLWFVWFVVAMPWEITTTKTFILFYFTIIKLVLFFQGKWYFLGWLLIDARQMSSSLTNIFTN